MRPGFRLLFNRSLARSLDRSIEGTCFVGASLPARNMLSSRASRQAPGAAPSKTPRPAAWLLTLSLERSFRPVIINVDARFPLASGFVSAREYARTGWGSGGPASRVLGRRWSAAATPPPRPPRDLHAVAWIRCCARRLQQSALTRRCASRVPDTQQAAAKAGVDRSIDRTLQPAHNRPNRSIDRSID